MSVVFRCPQPLLGAHPMSMVFDAHSLGYGSLLQCGREKLALDGSFDPT
ncbi:hypothetical protein A2U01_0086455, partial [Trifolium medium]|nr:hypothetical protein [Trifolium medium]